MATESAPLVWTEFHALHAGGRQPAPVVPLCLVGTSEPASRLRNRVAALAQTPRTWLAMFGEAGTGKFDLAQYIHARGPGGGPLLALPADAPHALEALDQLSPEVGRAAAAAALAVTRCEAADPAVLGRLDALRQHASALRVFVLANVNVDAFRARSPVHAALLTDERTAILEVPALRSRTDDLSALVAAVVEQTARRFGRPTRGMRPEALARLGATPMPGNLHQLRATVELAQLASDEPWLDADAFGATSSDPAIRDRAVVRIELPGRTMHEVEAELVRAALPLAQGRVVRASEILGITRHALRRKLAKHGLGDLRATSPEKPSGDDGLI